MSYTMYTPLNVWLDPASVTDVVAYIQNYLSENTIYSEEEIEELIHDYLIAHPELIGGVQSVNGKTGTVVLSASDINTANNVTIESVLASLSSQISSIAASVATNTNNITSLTGRVSTAETDLANLKSNFDEVCEDVLILGKNILKPFPNVSGGLTVSYEEEQGIYTISGRKVTGDPLRIVLGTISIDESTTYNLNRVMVTGTAPSMYVCLGADTVQTWPSSYSIINTSALTAGNTYTLEAYFPINTDINIAIQLQCEKATQPSAIVPYGYHVKESAILAKPIDLSAYKFSICGVSIDTYTGWIPSGNVAYYSSSNLASVDMTWWKRLMNKTGLSLVVNNSYSGSCASTINGLASSGVQRCISLHNGSTVPDIIIVGMFGANEWANTTVGEYTFTTALPGASVDLSDETTYNTYKDTIEKYKGAMATIFKRIHESYPNARVYALDMYNYYRGENLDPAGRSETQNIPLFNKALYDICEWFCVTVIKGSECGINAINSSSYCVDAATGTALHPNATGHEMIYKKVLAQLYNDYCH